MGRVILHSDFNNFYASVECLFNPALRRKPVAVAGDAEARHGIVLAKNEIAKRFGVKTGETLWQARLKCPMIEFVPANFDRYLHFSKLAGEIYTSYTDQVEPFGLDECWLDVTASRQLFGSGAEIADTLRDRIRKELGLTISVGVSFNKVFAKLGSDLRKPDATTVISQTDFREKVWRLSVRELLYVGPATERKLSGCGIFTIGELAQAQPEYLRRLLGKNGEMLWRFANGLDTSGVSTYYALPPVKSVSNSTTAPRDLATDEEIKIVLLSLCESVSARLREQRSLCSTVQLGVRDQVLNSYERQLGLERPTDSTKILFDASFFLFQQNRPPIPVRNLSVRAASLSPAGQFEQLSIFPEIIRSQKQEAIDRAVDKVRGKYGYLSLQRGLMLTDPTLNQNIREEHIVHPTGFLGTLS